MPNPEKFLMLESKVAELLGVHTTDGTLSYRPNKNKLSFFITGAEREIGHLNKKDISYIIEVYEHKSFERSDVIYIGDTAPNESLMHDTIYGHTKAKIILQFYDDKHLGKIKCPKVGYMPNGTKELANNIMRAIKRYRYNKRTKNITPNILELEKQGFLIIGNTWTDIKSTYIKHFGK